MRSSGGYRVAKPHPAPHQVRSTWRCVSQSITVRPELVEGRFALAGERESSSGWLLVLGVVERHRVGASRLSTTLETNGRVGLLPLVVSLSNHVSRREAPFDKLRANGTSGRSPLAGWLTLRNAGDSGARQNPCQTLGRWTGRRLGATNMTSIRISSPFGQYCG